MTTGDGDRGLVVSPRQQMLDLFEGYRIVPLLGAFAELGVADALLEGPASVDDLAGAVGAHPQALSRGLRALAPYGCFTRTDDGRIGLTPMAELLLSDRSGSLRAAAMYHAAEWHWRPYGHVLHSLRTGETGFRAAHGSDLFEYLASSPDDAAVFNDAMRAEAPLRAASLSRSYDFREIKTIVDVAGGHGSITLELLARHKHLNGVVFDLPEVIAGAHAVIDAAGLSERCKAVGGSMMREVPAGGDAYLVAWILHNWGNDEAISILRNCREAMASGGKVLVLEMVIPPGGDHFPGKALDLEMLVIAGGLERTEEEYRALFDEAGLVLNRVVPLLAMPMSLLEGTPKPTA